MIAYNYLNIQDRKKEKVHRILPIARFLDMLVYNKMTFVVPDLWDDPFENFFFQQIAEIADGEKIRLIDFKENIYGNCWTFNSDYDFSWRVYAPSKNGIQITTTIEKLYNHFKYLQNDDRCYFFQIGAVNYEKWDTIKEAYENRAKINPLIDLFLSNSMFHKRIEFSHEDEVRVLIKYFDINDNILRLDIKPNDLIDAVLLDPRLSDHEFKLYKELLVRQGFQGKIEQSNLYKIPELRLKFSNISKNGGTKSNGH